MQFGTNLPLVMGPDITGTVHLAQQLEAAGFDYVSLGGHVLGTDIARFPDRPQFTFVGPFHDPFVTFAYLAAVTQRLQFVTSILILPALPTPLVAKQSAALQIVSGGRFRLGVGISWNPLEYKALGQNISNRGRRIEEQIELLRRLWSEPYVSFEGEWEQLDEVGVGAALEQPIPIWIGSGRGEDQLRRAARIADGWVMGGGSLEAFTEAAQQLREYLEAAGRDIAAFELATSLTASDSPAEWIEAAGALRDAGATHLTLMAPPGLQAPQSVERIIEARAAISQALR